MLKMSFLRLIRGNLRIPPIFFDPRSKLSSGYSYFDAAFFYAIGAYYVFYVIETLLEGVTTLSLLVPTLILGVGTIIIWSSPKRYSRTIVTVLTGLMAARALDHPTQNFDWLMLASLPLIALVLARDIRLIAAYLVTLLIGPLLVLAITSLAPQVLDLLYPEAGSFYSAPGVDLRIANLLFIGVISGLVANYLNQTHQQQEALKAALAERNQHMVQQQNQLRRAHNQQTLQIHKLERKQEELIQARLHAERLMQEREMLFSSVSHELRTPINAVIGIAHLLNQEKPREDQKARLRALQFAAQNILHLIGDILDFAKLEEGKLELTEASLNLSLLMENLVETYRPLADEKGLQLILDCPDDFNYYVLGDEVRLGQVFSNLISNAIKFTETGKITIRIQGVILEDGLLGIEASVSDTGIGIPPEYQEAVFQRFSQGSSAPKSLAGSSGLGLSICQNLLQLMDSELILESEVNKGSTFSFDLALPLCSADHHSVETEEEQSLSLTGMNVLVAEDNPMNVEILTSLLENWEIDFSVVSTGLSAVHLVTQQPFDLVLMDLHMPEMDGYGAVAEIRDLDYDWQAQVPIVAMSAIGGQLQESMIRAGFDDFLPKPYHPDQLLNCLRRYHPGRQGKEHNSTSNRMIT